MPIDGIAVKATADGNGNNIEDTYATKAELNIVKNASTTLIPKSKFGSAVVDKISTYSSSSGSGYVIAKKDTTKLNILDTGSSAVLVQTDEVILTSKSYSYYRELLHDSDTGITNTMNFITAVFGDAVSYMPDGKYKVYIYCSSAQSNQLDMVLRPISYNVSISGGTIIYANYESRSVYSYNSRREFGTCVFEIYDIEYTGPLS